MDPLKGGYYLHTNGKLISKPMGLDFEDRQSNFVVQYWSNYDIGRTPQLFTEFLKEAKQLGALNSDIHRLANHNNLINYVPDWYKQVGIELALASKS